MLSFQSNWLFNPFPIFLESLVLQSELLVVRAIIAHLIGNSQPLILFPDSWGLQVAAAIPHLFGISLQLSFEACLFNPFFQSQVPCWELFVVHTDPSSWPNFGKVFCLSCIGKGQLKEIGSLILKNQACYLPAYLFILCPRAIILEAVNIHKNRKNIIKTTYNYNGHFGECSN